MERSIFVIVTSDRIIQIEDDKTNILDYPHPEGSVSILVEFDNTKLLVAMPPDRAVIESRKWGQRMVHLERDDKRLYCNAKIKKVLQNSSSEGPDLIDVAASAMWLAMAGDVDGFTEESMSQGNILLARRMIDTPVGIRHLTAVFPALSSSR